MDVTILLTHPPPVAPGLLRADDSLLDQDNRNTAPREFVGGAYADDAAADHNDIALSSEFLAVFNFVDLEHRLLYLIVAMKERWRVVVRKW